MYVAATADEVWPCTSGCRCADVAGRLFLGATTSRDARGGVLAVASHRRREGGGQHGGIIRIDAAWQRVTPVARVKGTLGNFVFIGTTM